MRWSLMGRDLRGEVRSGHRRAACLLLSLALGDLGCDETGTPPAVELVDGGAPVEVDGDRPGLDIRGVPENPTVEATFDALGAPPGEWVDPPECPAPTDDAHCATCWDHNEEEPHPHSLGFNQSGAEYGAAFAVGDYNGDGYPDVAVGVPGYDVDMGPANAGRVFVYLGSSRGFQPWLVLNDDASSGPHVNARFGAALARIDVDATDDHDDLVVGYGGEPDPSAVLVFEGQPDGFGTATVFTLEDLDPDDSMATDAELGFAMVVGDLDGDGDEDLAVGAPSYPQTMSTRHGAVFRLDNASGTLSDNGRIDGNADGDRFGHALAYMPSTDELYVGAPDAGTDGEVVPCSGSSKSTAFTAGSGAEFGTSVVVGDVTTASGYEVVVGGAGVDDFWMCESGSCSATMVSGTNVTDVVVLAADDLDGDGGDDLVLSTTSSSAENALHLFTDETDVAVTAWGARVAGDELGVAASVQDIDGDGLLDVLIGAPNSGDEDGRIYTLQPADVSGWTMSIAPTQTLETETELDGCTECEVFDRPDGSILCGLDDEDQICVFGECVDRECGDGYRQTGDEVGVSWPRESCDDGNGDSGDACDASCGTALLEVSSRGDAIDSPSQLLPAMAEDGNNDLLFVFGSDQFVDDSCIFEQPRNRLGAWVANYGGDIYPLYPPGGEPLCVAPFLVLAEFPGAGWDAEATAAGLPGGGFVVAFTSPDEDDAGSGIALRLVGLDESGVPTVTVLPVANQTEIGEQYEPRVAALTDGFIVVWTDASGVDGPFGRTLIKARRFTDAGAPIEDEWVVSDPDVTSSQPALAAIGDLFLVLYAEHSDDPFDGSALLAYREGPGGTTSGMKVSELNWAAEPTLAALDSSTFIAAWTARSSSDRLGQIEARTVPTTGDTVGTVSTFGVADETDSAPSVAPLSGDGYIVAWEADGRRRGLAYGYASMSGVPELEAEDLDELIVGGLQGDVTLLTTFRGTWFAWSDAHRSIGSGDALRSFVAFLLPGS